MKSFIVITCKKFYSYHVSSFQLIGDKAALVLAKDGEVKLIPANEILAVNVAVGIVNGEYKILD